MHIAYIAPYQGSELLKRRPVMQNLGLAANLKVELVAELLQRGDHSVEILSQGEVSDANAERMYYPSFREPTGFSPTIPVFYASALPVRRLNGFWSAFRTLQLLRRRHRQAPFDAIIVYNLHLPQVVCALYALRRLALPVVLEYEDDALVDITGRSQEGRRGGWQLPLVRKVLDSATACVGVSPHLLSRVSRPVPKVLLRGVVSENILEVGRNVSTPRNKWVVFSGTHTKVKGLEPLLIAWQMLKPRGWELHIAGYGDTTDALQKMADGDQSIKFHGLLNREENARLLGMSTIGINPHDLSETPGNVFAFKIIEYLAAGTHVITTPMGPLESELEAGITYMPDNSPQTIAATLQAVIEGNGFERRATEAANQLYGPAAVSRTLDSLLGQLRAVRG
jgi:glycosyltransferase involved in cell wall biosynthesis